MDILRQINAETVNDKSNTIKIVVSLMVLVVIFMSV